MRRAEYGRPFFCVLLEGACLLEVDGQQPVELRQGDFVLIPSARNFTMSNLDPAAADDIDPSIASLLDGEIRHGRQDGPPDVRLIETLRSTAGTEVSPGLLRGLADERLTLAIRAMHESPTNRWTVADLARQAGLSRSAFFDRFQRLIGLAPMEYLLAWRMALAKTMLREQQAGVGEIAERVGYGSASAFTRHVGLPPTRYAQQQSEL